MAKKIGTVTDVHTPSIRRLEILTDHTALNNNEVVEKREEDF
jgi:hypothetical protein